MNFKEWWKKLKFWQKLGVFWILIMITLWYLTGKNWQLRQNKIFSIVILLITVLVTIILIYMSRNYLKENIKGVKIGIIWGIIVSVILYFSYFFAYFFAYAPPWGYVTFILMDAFKNINYRIMSLFNLIICIILGAFVGAFVYDRRKKKSKK